MNTRKILLAPAIAFALLAATACGNDDAGDAGTEDVGATADTDDTTAPGDAEPTGSPGETLALVMAVDRHEVAMAEQAREKGVEGDVLAYADMLHTEHGANLDKDIQLAESISLSPLDTEAVQAHKEKGEAEMERLAELEGEAYADAYVDAMVMGHTEALAMLDERIGHTATDGVAPGATAIGGGNVDQMFQQHLTATREAVASHLEAGKALQAGEPMNAAPSMDTDGSDDLTP